MPTTAASRTPGTRARKGSTSTGQTFSPPLREVLAAAPGPNPARRARRAVARSIDQARALATGQGIRKFGTA
ncbi:hypothetical protein R1T08_03760 [Streptomyces sp. SBC-4]|nr:hypothetical protein [Streptomyces sp. SBC-4]MDV5143428.1 hypothetical protein [Streptomyces sp. SBC-4]